MTRASARKRGSDSSVRRGRMRGHRRELGCCFTTSTRITRQAKPSFPLQLSMATSLLVRRYVLSSRGSTHGSPSAYVICFITQATFSTSDARICTAPSIRSITTESTRSNAVRTKPRGKVFLCIESNMRIWRLLKPQPNNDTVGVTPQRKVAVLGGTDRAKITKKRGIFHDNRN